MNYIDQIVENARAAYRAGMPKPLQGIGAEQRAGFDAVEAYRALVNEDRFQRELLESNHWWRCGIGTAQRALRSVVLQLAKKIDNEGSGP